MCVVLQFCICYTGLRSNICKVTKWLQREHKISSSQGMWIGVVIFVLHSDKSIKIFLHSAAKLKLYHLSYSISLSDLLNSIPVNFVAWIVCRSLFYPTGMFLVSLKFPTRKRQNWAKLIICWLILKLWTIGALPVK